MLKFEDTCFSKGFCIFSAVVVIAEPKRNATQTKFIVKGFFYKQSKSSKEVLRSASYLIVNKRTHIYRLLGECCEKKVERLLFFRPTYLSAYLKIE